VFGALPANYGKTDTPSDWPYISGLVRQFRAQILGADGQDQFLRRVGDP
jgi:hypothetical protein